MSEAKQNKLSAFDWGTLKRIFAFSKPYSKIFYLAIGVTIILSALAIGRPLLIKKILDDYIAQKNIDMLTLFSGILLSMLNSKTATIFYRKISRKIIAETHWEIKLKQIIIRLN